MAIVYDFSNNEFNGVIHGGGETINIKADGLVMDSGPGDTALFVFGGKYILTVDGEVHGGTSSGIGIRLGVTAGEASKLTINTSGQVTGGSGGILAEDAFDIVNKGLISSSVAVTQLINVGKFSLNNSGEIRGTIQVANETSISIINSGLIDGIVDLDDPSIVEAAAKLTNSGVITKNVTTGEGADTISNKGTITGTLATDLGNDKVTNTGTITGLVSLEEGDDTYSGSKFVDLVRDEAGKDSYKLGDGFDIFTAVATGSGDANIDTVDGGTNAGVNLFLGLFGDTYDASAATSGIKINLDTVNQLIFTTSETLTKSQATGVDVGTDTVKGFEIVKGGSGSDQIVGNASANFLDGGENGDDIFGLKGNDTLVGGAGGDNIVGGQGRDTLWGDLVGNKADTDTDFFFFAALSDSTLALSGRDIIMDFQDGEDRIDFTKLVEAGELVSFECIGTEVNFSKNGESELRAIKGDGGWTLQLDANGDGKTDMAIDVYDPTHLITWSTDESDFSFAI